MTRVAGAKGLAADRSESWAERRQRWLRATVRDAAKRSFARYGYTNTSVQHILDEAGIARRTFYRHFSSKDEVFAELLEELVDQLCACLSVASEERSLRARLHARAIASVRAGSENRALLAAVDEAIRVNRDHSRRWDRLRETLEEQHRQAFEWCIEHGIMGPADTTLLSRMLSEIARSLLVDTARYEDVDPATVEATAAEVYWNILFRPHEGADDYLLEPGDPQPVFRSRRNGSTGQDREPAARQRAELAKEGKR